MTTARIGRCLVAALGASLFRHGQGGRLPLRGRRVIAVQDINDAYRRVERGDVRFRYVIDMASLGRDEAA